MSDTSAAQLAANRANGALSHGPVTPQGKQRSSLNAVRHGLTSRIVLLPADDLQLYQAFCATYLAALQPQGPVETGLAQIACDSQWRLDRARSYEETLHARAQAEPDNIRLSIETPTETQSPAPSLQSLARSAETSSAALNLSLQEQRVFGMLQRALKQLTQMQNDRLAQAKAEKQKAEEEKTKGEAQMEEAILLLNLHKTEATPFDPLEYGFVFTTPAIERAAWRRARLEAAQTAAHFTAMPPNSRAALKNLLERTTK